MGCFIESLATWQKLTQPENRHPSTFGWSQPNYVTLPHAKWITFLTIFTTLQPGNRCLQLYLIDFSLNHFYHAAAWKQRLAALLKGFQS